MDNWEFAAEPAATSPEARADLATEARLARKASAATEPWEGAATREGSATTSPEARADSAAEAEPVGRCSAMAEICSGSFCHLHRLRKHQSERGHHRRNR